MNKIVVLIAFFTSIVLIFIVIKHKDYIKDLPWKKHTDEKIGFEFSYPRTWTLKDRYSTFSNPQAQNFRIKDKNFDRFAALRTAQLLKGHDVSMSFGNDYNNLAESEKVVQAERLKEDNIRRVTYNGRQYIYVENTVESAYRIRIHTIVDTKDSDSLKHFSVFFTFGVLEEDNQAIIDKFMNNLKFYQAPN